MSLLVITPSMSVVQITDAHVTTRHLNFLGSEEAETSKLTKLHLIKIYSSNLPLTRIHVCDSFANTTSICAKDRWPMERPFKLQAD